MRTLEAAKKNLEARLYELAAQISYRNRAVYDVDAIQGTLQRFARFIYKLPIDQQIRIIRLMVDQVLLYKDRIRVELHELPISDLQRALDIKTGGGGGTPLKVQIPTTSKGGGHKTTRNGTAVVEVRQNWRARRYQDTNSRFSRPVPAPEKAYILPAFSIAWPIAWGRITNGERVVTETISSPDQKTTEFEVPEFKCRRALENTMGAIPPAL